MTQQIHEATGGWPLHAENKIREWIRAGTLTVDGKDPNRLRWDRLAADRISPVGTYEASVRQGLSFLTEQERSVLGAVALGSQETTLDQISSLLELDKEEVSSSVQLLHRANCLHMDKESVRCLETQIVRSIITEMPKDQVGELREKLWELGLLNPLYRVTWLVDEGHIDQAVEYAAEVMEQLYNREAPISALALIDNAIEDLAELNESESRNRLWLVYIRCVMAVRPSDPAARKLFAQLGESEYRESSLFEDYVAAQLLGVIGHYPAYKERLTQAWERHHDGRPSSTLLLVGLRLAWVEEQFGDLGRVSGWFEALQSVVARLGRKSARALVTQARARVAYIQGDFDDGMRLAEKAMSTLSDIEGVSTRAEVLPVYVDFLRLQGRFSEAVMHLSEALSAARSTEMPKLVVPLLLAAARCEVDLFRLGRAQEYIDELMVSMRPGEYLHLRLEATLLWGRVLVASGEYHHAAGVLTDTAGRAKAAGLCVIDGVSSALLGHVDCFLGNTLEGDTRMSQAVEMLCDQGRHSAALECALIWARARGATLNPDIIFKPVQALVEHPFATIPRLEWLIASRRFHGSSRGIDEAIHETISSILVNSSGMERSALRVHPWTRTVKLNRENTEDDR
jgi:tetratricopeptide (TPR) repeat protein